MEAAFLQSGHGIPQIEQPQARGITENILLQVLHGVVDADLVLIEEGVDSHPSSVAEHTLYLGLGETLGAVTFTARASSAAREGSSPAAMSSAASSSGMVRITCMG
jgi:hypothetical protein